jgi:hypothetical protein
MKEDINKAIRESFDVAKVTNVILDEIQKAFGKGFDLGVKSVSDAEFGAGGIRWHELCKNPDDLPVKSNHVVQNQDGDHVVYNNYQKKWFWTDGCSFGLKVIAWCEIPTFGE